MNIKALSLTFGSFFALAAVMLGAFGAHALKEMIPSEQLGSFETGVRYQMYHGLALILIGLKQHVLPAKFDRAITILVIVGVLFFSCSIYILSTSAATGLQWKWLGPITPVGGTLLIIAWALFLVDSFRLFGKKEA